MPEGDNPKLADLDTPSAQAAGLPLSTSYAAAFRCIGAECEDHCCGGWDIPLDRATYGRYLQFPLDGLGSVVSHSVVTNPPSQTPIPNDRHFATILQDDSATCPFFQFNHLCAIQQQYGPELLSATCSIYPRSLSRVGGVLEGSLSLSCPEAARDVLLDPTFIYTHGDLLSGSFRTDNVFSLAASPPDRSGDAQPYDRTRPESLFAPIRQLLIGIVRDRSSSIAHRLLQVGFLCRRIEEITAEDGDRSLPRILSAWQRIVEDDAVQAELDAMPADPRLLIEVIFALTNARLEGPHGRRFSDIFWSFVEGIGSPAEELPGHDIARFLEAERRVHRPFFERHPFILENYLLNYMLQNLFPYGRSGSAEFLPTSISDEYVLMATQFAWLNGLLIGVAANHGSAFSEAHVVQTVQSFTRAIEHNAQFLGRINAYIGLKQLDTLEGMASLLK